MGEHEKNKFMTMKTFFYKKGQNYFDSFTILPFLELVPSGSTQECLYPFGISKCER